MQLLATPSRFGAQAQPGSSCDVLTAVKTARDNLHLLLTDLLLIYSGYPAWTQPNHARRNLHSPCYTTAHLGRHTSECILKSPLPTLVAELVDTHNGAKSRATTIPESRLWRGHFRVTTSSRTLDVPTTTGTTTRTTNSSNSIYLASTTSRRINPIPRRADPTSRLGCYDRSSHEECHHTLPR